MGGEVLLILLPFPPICSWQIFMFTFISHTDISFFLKCACFTFHQAFNIFPGVYLPLGGVSLSLGFGISLRFFVLTKEVTIGQKMSGKSLHDT